MRDTQSDRRIQNGGPPAADSMIGQKVGEYVVEAVIAAGGMGIVYRAVHPLIKRLVAIKVVRPEWIRDQEQTNRFLNEAQLLSSIKHDRIIEIIGFGNLDDGRQYMVMEFLQGEPLNAVLTREGAMPPQRALALVDEILSGLSAAHKAGVVHRDLKPSNVFVSMQSNGEQSVKVLDFGLAKQSPVSLALNAPTGNEKASTMAGTPEYIAPEQVRVLVASAQSDLYCVGVMLFEMLSGELPFAASDSSSLMKKHVSEAPRHISQLVPGLPASLDALVATLLEKEPEHRPASADAVRQMVAEILRELRERSTHTVPNLLLGSVEQRAGVPQVRPSDIPALAAATAIPRQDGGPPLRNRRRWVLPVVGLTLAVVFGSTTVWSISRSRHPVALGVPSAASAAPHAPEIARSREENPLPPMMVQKPSSEPLALGRKETKLKAVPKSAVVAIASNPRCADLSAWRDAEETRSDEIEGRVRGKLVGQKATRETITLTVSSIRDVRERIKRATTERECEKAIRSLDSWAVVNGL